MGLHERLRGLIAYDAMAYNGPERDAQATRNVQAFATAGDPIGSQIMAAWQDLAQGRGLGMDALQRLLPAYFKDFRRIDASLAAWKKTAGMTVDPNRKESRWDIRDRLGEIAVPTLVIVGAADFISPENSARDLAEGIPGAEFVILKDSGHFGHVEEPETFRDAVLRFIAAH